jgi:CD109 antigen
MVTIHKTPYKIDLTKSSDQFKPGLPFSIIAFVNFHDKQVPVSDKLNPVEFTTVFYYDVMRICTRRRNGRSEDFDFDESEFDESYVPKPYECREEKNFEEKKEVFLVNGMAKIDIEMPSNTTKFKVFAKYLETENMLWNIEKAETENDEYIQAKLATENPVLSQKVKINVLANKPMKRLTYQVLSKGGVVSSETLSVPDTKTFVFEFTPSLAMIPQVKVVVYYITDDGEIISDSLDIEFGNELRNFVGIELSKGQAKPGEDLDITVSSNANSFVGLLGVDQSVLLLKKGNDIEKSTVFDELGNYHQISEYNFDWSISDDYRSYRDFDFRYSVIITNAKMEYGKNSSL